MIGVHTMLQTFLPLLQRGTKKIVINTSSGSGSLGRRYDEVFKLKLETMTQPNLLIMLYSCCTCTSHVHAEYNSAMMLSSCYNCSKRLL